MQAVRVIDQILKLADIDPTGLVDQDVFKWDETSGKLIHSIFVASFNGRAGEIIFSSGDVITALGYVPEDIAARGQALGYPTLDSNGKVLASQLPVLTISDTFVVASQAAMLATAADRGDVAVRTDLNKSFILTADTPTILAAWQELLTPTDAVTSVFGRAGIVTMFSSDIVTALGYTPRDIATNTVNTFNTRFGTVTLTSGDVTTALGYTPRNAAVSIAQADVTGLVAAFAVKYIIGVADVSLTNAIIVPFLAKSVHGNSGLASFGPLDDDFDGVILDSKWSWVNQSTANVSFSRSHIILEQPTGNGYNMLFQTSPNTPYRVMMHCTSYAKTTGVSMPVAMLFRESSTGKMTAMEAYGSSGMMQIYVQHWSSPTGFASIGSGPVTLFSNRFYMMIEDDGETLNFYTSLEGAYWQLMHFEARNFYMTAPNQVGFGINGLNAALVVTSDFFKQVFTPAFVIDPCSALTYPGTTYSAGVSVGTGAIGGFTAEAAWYQRATGGVESVTYHPSSPITGLKVNTIDWTSDSFASNFTFQTSPDGTTWTTITPTRVNAAGAPYAPGDWNYVTYTLYPITAVNYLKISWPVTGSFWNKYLSTVRLYTN